MISDNHNKNPASPGIPGLVRKMSLCERMFFMSPACTVMMAARIAGPLDVTRFRQALAAVSRIHPFLQVKVVFDDHHNAYFSSDGVPQVPLRVISRVSDRQWPDVLKEEARIPFTLNKGPLIRCVLLHSPEVSDLLVLCNHSICDGMALAVFIRDLLAGYGNPGRKTEVMNPPDVMEILRPGPSLKGLAGRIIAVFANRKWRQDPYHFGQEEYAALYRSYWEGRRPGIVLFEFDPGESERLKEICRSQRVSVGSALSAACLWAHAEITGGFSESQQKLMVPFDLRRRADRPVGNVFCLCVGSLQFPFACSPEKSFWQNAASLDTEVHSRLNTKNLPGIDIPPFDPSLMDALAGYSLFVNRIPGAYAGTGLLRKFRDDTKNIVFSLTKDFDTGMPGLVPTNLGPVAMPESSGDIRLDRLVFLPSSSEINPLVLGGAGAGGRIIFSLQFVDPPAKTGISPEPEMIRIRNRALELLGFSDKVHPCVME